MADIFLSHSSEDIEIAEKVRAWLERDRHTWSVFYDVHRRNGILAGQDWQDRLRSELQSCRLVLAVITPSWLESRWCFAEAVTASFRGKDFIGVLPFDVSEGELRLAPPVVQQRQRQLLDLESGAGWEDLLYALDHSGLDPDRWFSIPKGVGPYPGFISFEEKDAGVFFGRDLEITAYLATINTLCSLNSPRALAISGGSGTGKSSLLKAGIIPRLRQQPDWLVVPTFDLSRKPILSFLDALKKAASLANLRIDVPVDLPQDQDNFAELVLRPLRTLEESTDRWILLPIDQTETLLAETERHTQRPALRNSAQFQENTQKSKFLATIGEALTDQKRRFIVVFTVRTEYLPALRRMLPPGARIHEQSLQPINALAEVIEKPAARFGIEFEAGLVSLLISDTGGSDSLPLLAYILRELYSRFGQDNRFTCEEFRQLGGVRGAIGQKLREVLLELEPTPDELHAFRRAFVDKLVYVDERAIEGKRYLRSAVTRDAVRGAADRLINRLRDARLLIDGEGGTISIAHERLINNWEGFPLRDWLAEDSEDRRLKNTLLSRYQDHLNGGPLLRGKPLIEARELVQRDRKLSKSEPDLYGFIQKSSNADYRRKILQIVGTVAASLLIMVTIGSSWSARQTEFNADLQNRATTAQTLAVRSNELNDDELSILLNLEALRIDKTIRGEKSWLIDRNLRAKLSKRNFSHILRGHKNEAVRTLAFMPDGNTLVSGGDDGSVHIWNISGSSWNPTILDSGHDEVISVASNKDGTVLASMSQIFSTNFQDELGVVDIWDGSGPWNHLSSLSIPIEQAGPIAFEGEKGVLILGGEMERFASWGIWLGLPPKKGSQ